MTQPGTVARSPDGIRRSAAGRARMVSAIGLLLLGTVSTRAERLPLKSYTIADGLARDQVLRIVRDSRGLLWFCTFEGLSRFDGHTFTSYTTADGLPHRSIRDLLETRSGAYWIATGAGLVRFNPHGNRTRAGAAPSVMENPLFTVHHPADSEAARSIRRLYEDRSGRIWIGTMAGLYRLNQQNGAVGFHFMDLGMPARNMDDRLVEDILEDRRGALWVGTRGSGLYRVQGERVERYTTRHGLPSDRVNALVEDRVGQMWAGAPEGLLRLVENPTDGASIVSRRYRSADGLPGHWINSLLQAADGTLWVGTHEGLGRIDVSSPAPALHAYTRVQGLSDGDVGALAEDGDGNLWMRTGTRGVMKLARGGFVTYDAADGLGNPVVGSLFHSRSGALCVFGNDRLARFDGSRFIAVTPALGKIERFAWGSGQTALQDKSGKWWFATGQGLFRFADVPGLEDLARMPPEVVFTTANGLPGNDVFHIFEDGRDGIWIETLSALQPALLRWDTAEQTFRHFSEHDGWPATWVHAFREDGAGNVWIATDKGLARYRRNQFRFFSTVDGLPTNAVGAMHVDRMGRLWVTTDSAGVIRIEDPDAERLNVRSYSMSDGLSSNQTLSVTHDKWDRIYISTGRGVDRLDPANGQIRHYSTGDGLTSNLPLALQDRDGAVWFGTNEVLSRLVPEPDRPRPSSPVWISGVRVAGTARPLSELGVADVPPLSLGPNERHVTIDYFAVAFGTGELPRYQYKLEGSDGDWSAPTDQRTVHYASLAPGRYRFLVSAMTSDGTVSRAPASVAFTIARPFWSRAWFIALAGATGIVMMYVGHRYRVRRLLEIERVRTRIATDLHDDLGANLSRVAVLSEVVKRQLETTDERSQPLLTEIADSARALVGSLRDLVWAIDARHGTLTDVVSRVRLFASTMFDHNGVSWRLDAPGDGADIALDPEARRHVLLFFKEAIHNAARHAGCESVAIFLKHEDHTLMCEVADDGCGFEPRGTGSPLEGEGRGMRNMRARAAQLGGSLGVRSAAGQGTRITMTLPLKKRGRHA